MQSFQNAQTRTADWTDPTAAPRGSLLRRLVVALVQADARYRQKCKLRGLPDERLRDMGLTRRDADAAFYSRYGNHTADQSPTRLSGGR